MSCRGVMALGFAVFLTAALGAGAKAQSRADALAKFHEGLVDRYPDVRHINAETFLDLDPTETILFDVRPAREFDVAHVAGAIRVDPKMDGDTFLTQFRAQIGDRKPVFYCSVGERSSKLAQAVVKTGEFSQPVYNLEQGIFGWHNEARDLVDANGPTDCVHPFNRFWGRMLTRRDNICSKAR